MSLDFSRDGYEELFKNALRQGINLFCGAGFSVESTDYDDLKLPVGAKLLDELKVKFLSISRATPHKCQNQQYTVDAE